MAEGVETVEQLECLKAKGYRKVQRYYFGKPMVSTHLPAWHQGFKRTGDAIAQDPGNLPFAIGAQSSLLIWAVYSIIKAASGAGLHLNRQDRP